MRKKPFKWAVSLASACLASAVILGALASPQAYAAQQPAKAGITAVPVTRPAAAELAWLRTEMAKPAERAEILGDLETAFKGVGKVGVGPLPDDSAKTGVTPEVSDGHDSTHFWVTASYADIADGAIYSAIGACMAYLEPIANVCEIAGETLVDWSRGWGWANNHGVWAAIYWLPPHFTGGRW
jgi:hypothetical protein